MKKIVVLICIYSLFGFKTFAQKKSDKVEVLWGDKQDTPKNSTLGEIVGFDNSGFYVYKNNYKGFWGSNLFLSLEHYNNQFKKTNSANLVMENLKQVLNFEFFVPIKDELYLFSSFNNKKLEQSCLFVQKINRSTLLPKGDFRKIAEVNYTGKTFYDTKLFNFKISKDSSKFLLYYSIPVGKDELKQFGFNVFDDDLTQLWRKNVRLPYNDNLFDVEDYIVDNSGNVHLLGLIYNEKRKAEIDGVPNYKYQILSYTNNGNELNEYPVSLQGKYLKAMKIAINAEQEIYCAGFYSNEGTLSIIGTYFIKINNETKELTTKSFKEFEMDFITQNMTEKEETKVKKKAEKGKNIELFNYRLDDIILRDNGEAILIGEQYYIQRVTHTYKDSQGFTTTSTTYVYIYNDIIVVNISSEGTIGWITKIAKRQISMNDGGLNSSYVLMRIKDKLYFLFNDNVANLNYKGQGKVERSPYDKSTLFTLVEIDDIGTQKREVVFFAKDAKVVAQPKVCKQISGNELLIYGQLNKTERFAKVTFLD